MKTIQVVAAVIFHEGRMYATQRGYGPWRDYWEFPGGKTEPGETPEAALIREIREELDVGITVLGHLCDVEYDYPEFHLSMKCFRCRIDAGEPKLLEHEAARWLAKEELYGVNWLPADTKILPEIEKNWPAQAQSGNNIKGRENMEVRKLTEQEHFESNLISYVAFHMRMEDPEKAREESKKLEIEDWGAFSEDGRIMARILNYRFDSMLDGQTVANGGIGGVSTLPEYRNTGAIRAIFEKLIPDAYRNGEVFSTLYPFSHAFYRKFGYETVCWQNDYEFAPSVLSGYRFNGTAELWKPGDPVSEYTALYNRFAAGFNLAMRRDDKMMLEKHLKGEYYKDRKFGYLLRENGVSVAYLIFQDIRHDPAAILSVEDMAWDGRTGLTALLGFLGRFTADYGTIRMFLPACLQLFSFIRTRQAYEIDQRVRQGYMIRPINVKRMLEIIKKPEDSSFVIRVEGDEYIPENNGVWEVYENSAELTEKAPDLTVSIQAFGQLAAGSVSLAEALYRPDVSVSGNEDVLAKVFVRKPVLVEDHF